MKKFLLFIFLLNCNFVFAQTSSTAINAPCPASTAKASVEITGGNVDIKTCAGKTVTINGQILPAKIVSDTDPRVNQTFEVKTFGAKGDGVTDDTASFQAAFAQAVLKKGSTVSISQPAKYYKISGAINLANSVGVNVIGTSAPSGLPGADLTNETDLNGAIVFTGSGRSPFINAASSIGLTIKGVKIIYTNPNFTGDLVSLSQTGGADTMFALIDHCEFRGRVTNYNGNGTIALVGNAINARSLISASNAITSTIANNNFSFADVAVLGKIEGQGSYSNVINLNGNHYLRLKTAALKNAGEQWNSNGETFEGGLNGESNAYRETVPSISLTIDKGWFGDTSTSAAPSEWIKFKGATLRVTNSLFSQTSGDASRAKILVDATNAAIEQVYFSGNLNLYGGRFVELTGGSSGSIQQFSAINDRMSGNFGTYLYNPTGVPVFNPAILGIGSLTNSLGNLSTGSLSSVIQTIQTSFADNSTLDFLKLVHISGTSGDNARQAITWYSNDGTLPSARITSDAGNNAQNSTFRIFVANNTGRAATGEAARQATLQERLSINAGGLVTIPQSLNVGSTATIGKGGTAINKILRGAVAVDLPALAAGRSAIDVSFTLTGASVGDSLTLNPAQLSANLLILQARVSAANTVTVRVINNAGAAIDEPAGSWTYMLTR